MERATESHDTIELTRHDTVQKMMLYWVSVTLVEALALHPLLSFACQSRTKACIWPDLLSDQWLDPSE